MLNPAQTNGILELVFAAQATVFALIAGVLVLVYQQLSNTSPTSLKYFPNRTITALLSLFITILVLTSLLYASRVQGVWVIVLAILLTMAVFGLTVALVTMTRRWFDPKEAIRMLRRELQKGSDQTDIIPHIDALNELTATYTAHGYTSLVKDLLAAYTELVKRVPNVVAPRSTYFDEDQTSEPDPISRLVESIGQLAVNLAENNLETFTSRTAYLLSDLLPKLDQYRQQRVQLVANRIVNALLLRGHDEPAASFIRKMGRRLIAQSVAPPFLSDFYMNMLKTGLHQKGPRVIVQTLQIVPRLVERKLVKPELLKEGRMYVRACDWVREYPDVVALVD